MNDTPFKLLIIDDDEIIHEMIKSSLNTDITIYNAYEAKHAFEILNDQSIDFVFCDYSLPGMNGHQILSIIRENFPDVLVVMVSSHTDSDTIIGAMRNGAIDFLCKPFSTDSVNISLERAMRMKVLFNDLNRLNKQTARLKDDLAEIEGVSFIGESSSAKQVKSLIIKVSKSRDTSVLITGESGTGKELVAKGIHQFSERAPFYFGAVNTPAIQDTLFESEFFGHTKGSFTGAVADKAGWLEVANKGTMFLDEIGDLPEMLQVKLLRALEERKYSKVGSSKEIPFDVRIIAATNKTKEELASGKTLRTDLYHRIAAFIINIPPLRERREDIPILVNHFINHFSGKMRIKIERIEKDALKELSNYSFPGNVRELRNLIERAMILTDGKILGKAHFPDICSQSTTQPIDGSNQIVTGIDCCDIYDLEELEKQTIIKVLQICENNKSKAAQMLNIKWNALDRRLTKFNIEI